MQKKSSGERKRKKTSKEYISDVKKRKDYYFSQFRNKLKGLALGKLKVGYDYKLIILNPDENEITTYCGLSIKDFNDQMNDFKSRNAPNKVEIYKDEEFDSIFSNSTPVPKTKGKRRTKKNDNSPKDNSGELYSEDEDELEEPPKKKSRVSNGEFYWQKQRRPKLESV